MSTPGLSVRLRRIEERLENVAPVRLAVAEQLQAARRAYRDRENRGEPHPERPVLEPLPATAPWDAQDLRRRLIAARARAARVLTPTAAAEQVQP